MIVTEQDIGKRCIVDGQDIGKRCIVDGNYLDRHTFDNERGTIVNVTPHDITKVGVCFDSPHRGFHGCGGRCPNGYGYYISEKFIVKIVNIHGNGCVSIW